MATVEMAVELIVPDTTAITALQALKRMGIKKIIGLKRADYYKFDINGNKDGFVKSIGKADIIVNANKHRFYTNIGKGHRKGNGIIVNVLVQGIENDALGLLQTLKNRLGFKQIRKMEKGTLWTMELDAESHGDALREAKEITESLLYSEHYQKYTIL